MSDSRMNEHIPKKGPVVTRIAPSPTGVLHVGTLRTALFNYLYAKKYGGKFLLRIEDTDKGRSTKAFEQDILEGLEWAGLKFDGKIIRQSQRNDIYAKYIKKLIDDGNAYISKESKKNHPKERIEVVRLKNPNKKITFIDLVRGDITFDTTELKDFVIARSVTEPLYHLAVVIDDHDMNVTHVIRGEDHISNTPRQILIHEALGFKIPKYGHLPLILNENRSKLSKRDDAASVTSYKDKYLPEALINYLALLGWNPGTDQEIFSLLELIEAFEISDVQRGGAIFNEEKLKSINHEYIKKLSEKIWNKIVLENLPKIITSHKSFDNTLLQNIAGQLKERVKTFEEIRKLGKSGELNFYVMAPEYNSSDLVPKRDSDSSIKQHLETLILLLGKISENKFTEINIKEAVWDYAEKEGKGSVLWPMRFALTGLEKSPDPFTVSGILGKSTTLERLKSAYQSL
ncbi:glutamate--tRNA ligase [Patescibacteria group bacterium]|nr:glutamate--tRNA ligase [Patescibacteria group bacterium]